MSEGNLTEAIALLKEVPSRAVVGRPERTVRYAQLAWRAGAPELGVSLLHPIVRNRRANKVATAPQRLQYALCLIKIGAVAEGEQLLARLADDKKVVPEVYLYYAFSRMTAFDFESGARLLRKYLKSTGLTSYAVTVGEIGLAEALLNMRELEQADALLEKLLSDRREHSPLSLRKTHEILAQSHFFKKNYSAALEAIGKCRVLMEGGSALDRLFLKKWEAIIRLASMPSAETQRLLDTVRLEAQALFDWETVRDCDRFLSIQMRDEVLLLQVYFSTPYPYYRRIMLQDYDCAEMPPTWEWKGKKSLEHGPALDLTDSGSLAAALDKDPLLLRCLRALLSDLYRPFKVAELYAALFPDDTFRPTSATERVATVVSKLKAWLHEKHYPLLVEETVNGYRLARMANCRFLLPNPDVQAEGPFWTRLRQNLGESVFSAKEAAEILGIPTRTAQRRIREGIEQGAVVRESSGKKARYFFKQKLTA